MYAIRSYYEGQGGKKDSCPGPGAGGDFVHRILIQCLMHRITSYNVCYTKLLRLFLVAPEHLSSKVLKDEQNSFTLKGNLGVLTENAEKVVFFHSEDDPVVSFDNQAIFKEMVPDASYNFV